MTLFLCCTKPGGAFASFPTASQESNSSLSLNCQSFVPGHSAEESHLSNSLPALERCCYFSVICRVVCFAQVMRHLGDKPCSLHVPPACATALQGTQRGPWAEDTLLCSFLFSSAGMPQAPAHPAASSQDTWQQHSVARLPSWASSSEEFFPQHFGLWWLRLSSVL